MDLAFKLNSDFSSHTAAGAGAFQESYDRTSFENIHLCTKPESNPNPLSTMTKDL